MMPHEVIEDTLGHALGAQVTAVELLVAPFDPACLRGHAIDEAEGVHLLGMRQGEASEDIGARADTESNHGSKPEVTDNEQQLFRQLFHGRVHVAAKLFHALVCTELVVSGCEILKIPAFRLKG